MAEQNIKNVDGTTVHAWEDGGQDGLSADQYRRALALEAAAEALDPITPNVGDVLLAAKFILSGA